MKEAFGYRTGAVQAMDGFELYAPISEHYPFFRKSYLKECAKFGKLYTNSCDLSMFSLETVKKALKKIKRDYPGQSVKFGKFSQNGKIFLAIQPERPTPPDQWMVVGQVVTL